jgi:hypothetical protein
MIIFFEEKIDAFTKGYEMNKPTEIIKNTVKKRAIIPLVTGRLD